VSTGDFITYHEDEVRSFRYTILQTYFVEIPQQCIPPFLILLLLLFKEAPLFGLLQPSSSSLLQWGVGAEDDTSGRGERWGDEGLRTD